MMKKQDYQTPAIRVVKMKYSRIVCGSDPYTKGNARLHRSYDDSDYEGDIR